jgi:hypothetical protein
MRDIRSDLQDRAEALERELKAAQSRFDELMVRLKEEHDGRLEDLKNELDAVKLLMGLEQRRLANGIANGHAAPKPQPQAQQSEAPRPQSQANPPRAPQQEPQMRRAG